MSDLDTDFVEIQVGGGRPDATAPPVLTPTRLRTSIKAADRDGGLISKARIRRTHQTAPSITENPNKSLEINPFLEEPEIGCASELFQTTDDVVFVDFLQTPSRKNSVATCMVSCLRSPFLFTDYIHFTRLSRVTNAQGEGLRAALER